MLLDLLSVIIMKIILPLLLESNNEPWSAAALNKNTTTVTFIQGSFI